MLFRLVSVYVSPSGVVPAAHVPSAIETVGSAAESTSGEDTEDVPPMSPIGKMDGQGSMGILCRVEDEKSEEATNASSTCEGDGGRAAVVRLRSQHLQQMPSTATVQVAGEVASAVMQQIQPQVHLSPVRSTRRRPIATAVSQLHEAGSSIDAARAVDHTFKATAERLITAATDDEPRLELDSFFNVIDVLRDDFGWRAVLPAATSLQSSYYFVKNPQKTIWTKLDGEPRREVVKFSTKTVKYFWEGADYLCSESAVLAYVHAQLEARGHDVDTLAKEAKAFNEESRRKRKRIHY